MNTTLWMVGQVRNFESSDWEFQGIFDSKERAIAACRSTYYFYSPVTLNEEVPDESIQLNSYYDTDVVMPGECIFPLWTGDTVNER